MTFVFVPEYGNAKCEGTVAACGEDFREVAEDINLPQGTYKVYQTDNLPDEIRLGNLNDIRKMLQYITLYDSTTPGA